MKITPATRDVLIALAQHDPAVGSYGSELARESDRSVGTVHAVLTHLEGAGYVTAEWEQIDPREAGRPAVRFWRLTPAGGALAQREHQAEVARITASAPHRKWLPVRGSS